MPTTRVLSLLGLLIALAFCAAAAAPTAQPADFWQWFATNEEAYYKLDPQDEAGREPLFNELQLQLGKINPNLTFEFGPLQDGRRDFVISADGIRDAFPAVKSLVEAAPSLPHWKVIAFRPRRNPVNNIEFGKVRLDPRQVIVTLAAEGDKVALVVYLPGYTEAASTDFGQAGFLLLDEALGEYDVETKVGSIDFMSLPAHSPPGGVPMSELSVAFDRFRAESEGN